jgi:hypothetical protein
MKAFLWRALIAAICFALFWWIFPLFLNVISAPISGSLLTLIKAISAALAVIYVIFGPEAPYPW